jgi:lipoprotein-releasing system ATP-binding protein
MSEPALKLSGVARSFPQGRLRLDVLKNIELTVQPGEMVALVGPSGSGKSTLLHIAGLLEKPDSGEVWVGGEAGGKLSDDKRTLLRRHHLGFVYQYHHLLPEFSAIENVVMPQMIAGVPRNKAVLRAGELLGKLGLEQRGQHRPGQLSGGEQQRVAIARALANRPKLLLADEPTGNLDPSTSEGVFTELLGLAKDQGLAALIATHNPDLAGRMDRTVRLAEGKLIEVV